MAQCLVNERPTVLDFRPETWGELLRGLDRTLGAERRVVTAVRFDGVDQPSFREPAVALAALSGIARIDVDAEDATALVAAALDAAADSVPALVRGTADTAAALRADAAAGSADLAALFTALHSLVALTHAAAYAARVSLGGRDVDAGVHAACRGIEAALERVVQHQISGDATRVADALESDLAPAVASWNDVLAPIREGVAA